MVPTLTPEQRSQGGKTSAQQRRAERAELERLRALLLTNPPVPQPAELRESYIADRLVRVRKQIDSLSTMLEGETDPNKLDRLANAISRMSELERQLANRPLPGSLKPSTKPSRDSRPRIEPVVGPACGPDTPSNGVPPQAP